MCAKWEKIFTLSFANNVILKVFLVSVCLLNMVFTVSDNIVDDNASVVREDFGRVWKKWLFCFIAYLPFLTRGLQTTYLDGIHEVIPKSETGVPWTTTGSVAGAMVSAPIFCWMADKYGRRVAIFVVSIIQIISWILLMSGATLENLIAIHVISGIATGGVFTILPIYVRELQHRTRHRSIPISLMMVMMMLGYLVMKILMINLKDEVIEYVVMGLVIVQFMMTFSLIETPSFYVRKEEFGTAKIQLSKLKCLESESPYVIKQITKLKEESVKAKSHGELVLFNILTNRIWRDAAKVCLIVYTFSVIGGKLIYLDHEKVLETSQVTVDGRVLDLAAPAVMVFGSLVGVAMLGCLEHKYILAMSYALTAVALGVLGVFMQKDIGGPSTPWLPVAALVAVLAGHSLAWGLPYVIVCEMLNLEIRATLAGALFAYSQLIYLVHVHTYQYIEDYTGIHALCYLFALTSILGAVYSLFHVPDLREKSVKQIENKLKRIPVWML